jgi:hypothetical protein
MTTRQEICNAYGPEYRQRHPPLPLSQQKTISAMQNCRSGHYGHSLYRCQGCGGHHRVNHSWGNRHGPQCQHHTTQLWLHTQLANQLPVPHFLITFTVPETLSPFLRSHPQVASQALCKASSTALKRLAQDERFLGTDLPGFTGVLHTWGRQLQDHPHLHSSVPGGGLSKDRPTWRPSRANFCGPVKALSPISRAVCKDTVRQTGLLDSIDPRVWTTPGNVHSQARPDGHAARTSLAPSVFRGAISNRRLVALEGRTVPFTYRQPGSARPRPTRLEVIEFLRRFLQQVLPEGFQQVRHVGCQSAGCSVQRDTLRRMIAAAQPLRPETPRVEAPPPLVATCPICGQPMQRILRRWTPERIVIDTGCEHR